MNIKEVYVKSRKATAVTSMKRVNDSIYLGLTGGSDCLYKLDVNTDEITACADVFPWVKNRGYNVKIHNSLGVLNDGKLIMGECSHFTWDGLPVFNSYLKSELPEVMLKRKREQGYEDIANLLLTTLNNGIACAMMPAEKLLCMILLPIPQRLLRTCPSLCIHSRCRLMQSVALLISTQFPIITF